MEGFGFWFGDGLKSLFLSRIVFFCLRWAVYVGRFLVDVCWCGLFLVVVMRGLWFELALVFVLGFGLVVFGVCFGCV